MPNVASSLGTTQRYIPAVPSTQIGRFANLSMFFPTLAGLNSAVADERLNIDDTSGMWSTGQPFSVGEEPVGVRRTWLIGASSALSHARTAHIRDGLNVVLAADTNIVRAVSGVPGAGIGADGDVAVDYAGNTYYTKAAGAWAQTGSIFVGAAGGPLESPTLNGSVTLAGSLLIPDSAMGASVIDIGELRNTKTLTADTTFTLSGAPVNGAEFGLELTGDVSNRTVTLPASCVRTDTGELVTSFVMPANRIAFLGFRRVGVVNYVDGVPGYKILIPFAVEVPADGDYTLILKSIWAGAVTAINAKCTSGTCTLTGKVNATPLGGAVNAVSSVEQSQAHATSNVIAVGDDFVATISANAACARLVGSIEMTVF